MIKIVDYGMGNLRSVQKAFEKLGFVAEICNRATDLADADKMVLPGVGAFRDAIHDLQRQDMARPIHDHIEAGKPFLGICLGLQLLFDVSYEDGQWDGLGIVRGKVIRFEDQPDLKIPHMGWNSLSFASDAPLMNGIPHDAYVYFVHSYYVAPADDSVVLARSNHGQDFVAAIAQDNLFATQFHPEKSQRVGMKLLSNFAAL